MQRSPYHSPPSSLPSSPVLRATSPYNSVPFVAPLDQRDVELHMPQRRLLVPEVRSTRISQQRQPKAKGGILGRPHRSSSVTGESSSHPKRNWVSSLGKLQVVQERLELHGYQIYAVEKWYIYSSFALKTGSVFPFRVVVRSRLVNTVCVYTGSPHHKARSLRVVRHYLIFL